MIRRISFRRVSSSLQRIIALRHFLAVTAIAIGFSSCYNEPEIIGGDLLPSEDLLSVKFDTSFVVSAYTVKTDSIPTNIYSEAVLGCFNSDMFGKVKADFCSRILVFNINDTILYKMNPRPSPISLELKMKLVRTWGTEKHPINVKVYQLQDSLSYSYYYNGLNPIQEAYNDTLISLPTTYSGEDTLTIQLTDSFARKITTAPDSALFNNTNFIKLIKGLYITSDDYSGSEGVLYSFDYRIVMQLHYKYLKAGVPTDTSFILYTSTYSPRYNHYDHFDYTNATIKPFIDTTTQHSTFYVDGLGGVRGLIKLNGVQEWLKKMPIAINRAELQFDVQDSPLFPEDSIVNPLRYYYKRFLDRSFTILSKDVVSLFDYQATNVETTNYNKAKKCYSIDITLHLQNLLRGKESRNYFFIEPADFKTHYQQGMFRSGNNIKPMKLIITYSKL